MTRIREIFLLVICFVVCANMATAQQDTAHNTEPVKPLFDSSNEVLIKTDSTNVVPATKPKLSKRDSLKLIHDPRKATFRSAVIPGWGQAYNREYWKIPIVYGALAIPVSLYIYNNSYYQMTKFAY